MKLPSPDVPISIDAVKIEQYCLSETHSVGKHKARVFKASLGMTAEHSDLLMESLLQAARQFEARLAMQDDHGTRYMIDFDLEGPGGTAMVRSIWIILKDEDFPRFVTCFVL